MNHDLKLLYVNYGKKQVCLLSVPFLFLSIFLIQMRIALYGLLHQVSLSLMMMQLRCIIVHQIRW